MKSGASTMPTKMLAPAERPTAPPIPIVSLEPRGHRAHDGRKNAPVEEKRSERAQHEHQRQRAKRQHEARGSRPLLERLLAAAQEAEHEAGSLLRRLLQREERVVQFEKERLGEGHLEQQRRERDLEQRAGSDDAPGKGAAVLGEEPGDAEEGEEAECALEGEQGKSSTASLRTSWELLTQ
jgi:hypothetical protein